MYPCRIGKSHPRGRNFNQGLAEPLVEILTPRVKFPYPAWTGSWRILFLPPLSGLFRGIKWLCEIEVSHMDKKPTLYRQRWENRLTRQTHNVEVTSFRLRCDVAATFKRRSVFTWKAGTWRLYNVASTSAQRNEIYSTVTLSLPLIQEGQLSVSGERITLLVNDLDD